MLFVLYIALIFIRLLSIDNHTTIAVYCLTTDLTAVCTRQKHHTSRDLAWLSRPSHRARELLDRFVRHGRRDQRRPDRSWRNSVNTDALADELVREAASEGDDGALGGRVVEEVGTTDVGVYGGIVDDYIAFGHVREGVFGEEEEC